MGTNRAQRSSLVFWLALGLVLYVICSASIAVATANACDGSFHADKSWQPFPPHWECNAG